MKNTIGDGMKMFRKYQLAVWRSIQNFYSHFVLVALLSPVVYCTFQGVKNQMLESHSKCNLVCFHITSGITRVQSMYSIYPNLIIKYKSI